MRAMILAAGLGTRLRPLTVARPKVLVPVFGITPLEFWIERLSQAGFEAVIVNAFHLRQMVVEAVMKRDWPIPVEVSVEPILLGTAGGIRKVLDFFQEKPIVVINGDILADLNLAKVYEDYLDSKAAVGMLVHDIPAFNNVALEGDKIIGFGEDAEKLIELKKGVKRVAFTGIHFIRPSVLEAVPEGEPAEIIPLYNNRILAGDPPRAVWAEDLLWREIGSVESYRNLHWELAESRQDILFPVPFGSAQYVHASARVSPRAVLKGKVVIGKGTSISEGSVIEDSIFWEEVTVHPGTRLKNCIVSDRVQVSGNHEDEILVRERF